MTREQSLNIPQYWQVNPYTGHPYDTRRVYTEEEMKQFYNLELLVEEK